MVRHWKKRVAVGMMSVVLATGSVFGTSSGMMGNLLNVQASEDPIRLDGGNSIAEAASTVSDQMYVDDISEKGEKDWFSFTTPDYECYTKVYGCNYSIFDGSYPDNRFKMSVRTDEDVDKKEVSIYQGKSENIYLRLSANTKYYIKFYSGGGYTGQYQFGYSFIADSDKETLDDATEISLDKGYDITLAAPQDEDYFKFVAPVSGAYSFYLRNRNISSETKLTVYNKYKEGMLTVTAGNQTEDTQTLELEAGTTYYIGCSNSKGNMGDYAISVMSPEDSIKKNIGQCKISLEYSCVEYTGETNSPRVTVKDGDNPLVCGTDYEVDYQDNIDVGVATVVVTGIGKYEGTCNESFHIIYGDVETEEETTDLPDMSDDFTCEENSEGTLTITGYKGDGGDVVIPNQIKGKTVTKIGSNAFENCKKLNSISISDSVTSIGEGAFLGCSGLVSISIPEGVTTIGQKTFYECESLQSVEIPESMEVIGYAAFYGCGSLKNIELPNKVRAIGKRAFYGCGSLQEVKLPDEVELIRELVFSNCTSLKSIEMSPKTTGIEKSAFSGCSSLENIVISDSVTSIGEGAFLGCSGLVSISIPEGVTTIGQKTFYECESLKSVEIPESMEVIGYAAFYGCGSLENIEIPNKVRAIGKRAFYGCGSLQEVKLPDEVKLIRELVFSNCTSLKSIEMSPKTTEIEKSAFLGCSSLENIVIPESVEKIAEEVFSGCSSLKSISIPEGVTTIGQKTFNECENLQKVELPDSIEVIGYGAFLGCSSLKNIAFPNSVRAIGKKAFEGCSGLQEIKLPDAVVLVREFVFSNCIGLKKIEMSPKTTEIEKSAFSGCGSLKSIVIPDKVTKIGSEAFLSCGSLEEIVFPGSVGTIEERAFYRCGKLKSLELLSSVKSIGTYAFKGCSKLKLCVEKGSNAEEYAKKNKISYEVVEHEWNEGAIIKKATCTEYGQKLFNCLTCEKTKMELIEKHPDTTIIKVKKATPKAKGYTGDTYCKSCKEITKKGTDIYIPKTIEGVKATYEYRGSLIKPYIVVKDSKGVIISPSNYKVTYNSNTLPGTAKVVIDFKGNKYNGRMSKTFKIMLPNTSVSSVKNTAKGKVSVNWSNKAKIISGYQIKYSNGKTSKTVNVIGAGKKNTTISGLLKGKTYDVSVRTYVKSGKKTYYGAWSKGKKIKITK